MRYRIWQTAVMALLIGAQGGLWTAEAQASGLFDWLSRCGSSADPQVMYYPVTTAYQTSACDCGEPSVSCQSPDPMCCPPTAIYQPRPSFWPRLGACWASPATQPMVSMAPPQTYYRTSWKKIPVTSYRPVMSTDPVTGCPVTVMKPCATYTWQAGRERCGFFDRLFGRCDPPATQVQCCVPTTCSAPTEYAMGGESSGCCGATVSSTTPIMASPAPTPAPYYAPGPPSVLTVPPGSASPAPTLAPQGMPPATGGVPQGPQPPAAADRRPTLKPAEVAPESPSGGEPPQAGLPWNSAPANPAASDAPESATDAVVGAADRESRKHTAQPCPGPGCDTRYPGGGGQSTPIAQST